MADFIGSPLARCARDVETATFEIAEGGLALASACAPIVLIGVVSPFSQHAHPRKAGGSGRL
jgi:hypothetical protein